VKKFKINITSNLNIPSVNLAIGNFDGIHIGHQKIIQKLVNESKKMNVQSAILDFDPHPQQFFTKNYDGFNVINEKTKIELLDQLNVDYYITMEFNSALASLSAHEFIENILSKKLNINNLTVGYDFKFGKNRQGDVDLLEQLSSKYNYNISIIEPVLDPLTSEIYSSSLVRKNIKDGNFERVSSLLGRNWIMQGTVIRGNQKASKINFPTANIIPSNLIKPKKGVYVVKVQYINKYINGIANFGVRPTIDGKKLLLEVNLFDFNQDIYGKELTVEFLTFIRDEKKFDNFTLLTEQIQKDIQLAKIYHSKK
jgi:riboflavin kinase/FMN adenylyltransferase